MANNRPQENEAKSEYIQFTAKDLQVIHKNGIPPGAAAEMLLQSQTTMCSVRGNDSDKPPTTTQRYRRSSALKPGSIQAKSCNAGPARSFICVDEDYSKFEKNTQGILEVRKIKPGDIPANQPTTDLTISLQEIIHGINNGDYKLLTLGNNELTFSLMNDVPDKNKLDIFKIRLNEGIIPEQLRDISAIEVANQSGLATKSTWWDEAKAPNYEAIAAQDFKQYYKKPEFDNFQPFKVLAIKQGNRVLPIVSDIDQFMLGFSGEYLSKILEKNSLANTPFMAMDKYPNVVKDFLEARLQLELDLLEMSLGRKLDFDSTHPINDIDALSTINKRISEGNVVKGNITPLESLYSDMMNDKFLQKMPHLQNFFQHASEMRNPYEPSKNRCRCIFH